MLNALRPFFDHNQLPKAKWIMSWDVRGAEPQADAVATAGRLQAQFKLPLEQWRQPIRVDQLADSVIVHMMKKGLLGKAKPSPVELGKYVMVAFERTQVEHVITLREKPDKQSQGLRFAVTDTGATWQSITAAGDAETEPNPLDVEDVEGIRRLGEGANRALKDLTGHRTLVDLTLGGKRARAAARAARRPPRAARPAHAARAHDPRTQPDLGRARAQARHRGRQARGALRAARAAVASLCQVAVRVPAAVRGDGRQRRGHAAGDPAAREHAATGEAADQPRHPRPYAPASHPAAQTMRAVVPDQDKTVVGVSSDDDKTNALGNLISAASARTPADRR